MGTSLSGHRSGWVASGRKRAIMQVGVMKIKLFYVDNFKPRLFFGQINIAKNSAGYIRW